MEALLHAPLNGTQWRILLWVIRQTYGWNRHYVRFSWYKMARDLGLSRPAVYRAGSALLTGGILLNHAKQLAVQADPCRWTGDLPNRALVAQRQLWIPGMAVAAKQRIALPSDNAGVVNQQPKRCQEATLFRRGKDSSKDRIKTYIKTRPASVAARHRFQNGAFSKHPAGAGQPIPGKYDGVS